jgi:hypothetical protein
LLRVAQGDRQYRVIAINRRVVKGQRGHDIAAAWRCGAKVEEAFAFFIDRLSQRPGVRDYRETAEALGARYPNN